MKKRNDGLDVLPELSVSGALLQSGRGLGSNGQVVRLALAISVAWLIAISLTHSQLGIFAPLTALIVVQTSPWSTVGVSVQRILGTGAAVLVSALWVNSVGLSWWSFTIAILVSLLAARALPWSAAGQLQIPTAVYVYPPRPKPEIFEAKLQLPRDAAIAVLESIGLESGSATVPLESDELPKYITASRALQPLMAGARSELGRLVESVQFNPRGVKVRGRLKQDVVRLRQIGGIVIQIRGIAGSADLLYDRGSSPRLSVAELREIITLSSRMARVSLGAGGDAIGATDLQLLAQVDESLHALLRRTVDEFMSHNDTVSDALASVSLVGRFDNFRQQLMLFHNLGPATELDGA